MEKWSLFLSFLFPASWNADVMDRSQAATLGHEDEAWQGSDLKDA